MAKAVGFTREAAQRVANAVRKVEGGADATVGGWYTYRSDEYETRFLRIAGMLPNCGTVQASAVTIGSVGDCGAEFKPVAATGPQTVRDIASVVRTFRFAMDQDPDQPLDPGTVVECDFQKPANGSGFWRVLRVVECDCSSGGSSSSSTPSSSHPSSSDYSSSNYSSSDYSSSLPSYSTSSSEPSYSTSTSTSYSTSYSTSSHPSYSSSTSTSSDPSYPSSGSGSGGSGSGGSGSGGSGSGGSGSGGSGSGGSGGSGSGSGDPCATVNPESLRRASPVVRMVNGRATVEGVTLFGFDAGGDLVRVDMGDLVNAIVDAVRANP